MVPSHGGFLTPLPSGSCHSWGFCCCGKHLVQKQLGEEKAYFPFPALRSHSIAEGSQDRNPSWNLRQGLKQRPRRSVAHWLAPHDFLSMLVCATQGHPQVALPTVT